VTYHGNYMTTGKNNRPFTWTLNCRCCNRRIWLRI